MQFQVNFSRKRISSFPNFTTILIFVKKNLCHISTRSGTWQVYLHRNPLCIWRPVAKKVAIFRVIPAYSSQNTYIDKHCVLILGSSNFNFAVMQYLFLKVVTLWRIETSIICSIYSPWMEIWLLLVPNSSPLNHPDWFGGTSRNMKPPK